MQKQNTSETKNKDMSKKTLHGLLEIYFSTQNEHSPYAKNQTDLTASQLSALIRGMPIEYSHPFKLNVSNEDAAIHYCYDNNAMLNPMHGDFPVEGYFEPEKQTSASVPDTFFTCQHDNSSPQNDLLFSKLIYFSARLRLLNSEGELDNIRYDACTDEDYSLCESQNPAAFRIVKDNKGEGPVQQKPGKAFERREPTDPRMIASSKYRNARVDYKTDGNLLVDRYGLPFVSSVAMSCINETTFCEAALTYLLGIANQEGRWMRFQMLVDLLRTFVAAMSRHAMVKEIDGGNGYSPYNSFSKIVDNEYRGLIKGHGLQGHVSASNLLGERQSSPFIGQPTEGICQSYWFKNRFLNMLIDFSKTFREFYRTYDGIVLDYHWEKLFAQIGETYPVKEVKDHYAKTDNLARKPKSNKELINIARGFWKEFNDVYSAIDEPYENIKDSGFTMDVGKVYEKGLLISC